MMSLPLELARRGYQVTVVNGGLAALNRARSLLPDLIVLGPALEAIDGLDGFLVCDLMQSQPSTGDIPVVVVASSTHPPRDGRASFSKAIDVVDPLAGLDDLLGRLERAMGIRRWRLQAGLGHGVPQDANSGVDCSGDHSQIGGTNSGHGLVRARTVPVRTGVPHRRTTDWSRAKHVVTRT